MQRMLMQFKQRFLEVVDEMTVLVSRVDESCAVVSSLIEEVQQRKGEDVTPQDVVVIVRSTTRQRQWCRSEKGPEGQDGQEAMAKIVAIMCRTP